LKALTARVPEELLEDLKLIEAEEKAERADVVRKLLDGAIRQWRLEKALRMVSEGRWTIRRAAGFARLTYYDFLERMAEAEVSSGPRLEDLGK